MVDQKFTIPTILQSNMTKVLVKHQLTISFSQNLTISYLECEFILLHKIWYKRALESARRHWKALQGAFKRPQQIIRLIYLRYSWRLKAPSTVCRLALKSAFRTYNPRKFCRLRVKGAFKVLQLSFYSIIQTLLLIECYASLCKSDVVYVTVNLIREEVVQYDSMLNTEQQWQSTQPRCCRVVRRKQFETFKNYQNNRARANYLLRAVGRSEIPFFLCIYLHGSKTR